MYCRDAVTSVPFVTRAWCILTDQRCLVDSKRMFLNKLAVEEFFSTFIFNHFYHKFARNGNLPRSTVHAHFACAQTRHWQNHYDGDWWIKSRWVNASSMVNVSDLLYVSYRSPSTSSTCHDTESCFFLEKLWVNYKNGECTSIMDVWGSGK